MRTFSKMSTHEELIDAVLAAAGRGTGRMELPCAEAFRLAEKWRAELLDIARICNQNNVKITACQLGCFK